MGKKFYLSFTEDGKAVISNMVPLEDEPHAGKFDSFDEAKAHLLSHVNADIDRTHETLFHLLKARDYIKELRDHEKEFVFIPIQIKEVN